MKKIYTCLPILIIFLLAVLFSGFDSIAPQQGYYYWHKGEKVWEEVLVEISRRIFSK